VSGIRISLGDLEGIYKKMFKTQNVRIKKLKLPDGQVLEGDELKNLMENQNGSNRK